MLLLTVAAGALLAGFTIAHREDQVATRRPSVTYGCPMHPEVVAHAPGDCPICRMALERRGPRSGDDLPAVPAATLADGAPAGRERRAAPAPGTVVLPLRASLHEWDARSRVKRYETAREMRVPCWFETAGDGFALFHLDENELVSTEETASFLPARLPADGRPPAIMVRLMDEPAVRWDAVTTQRRFRIEGKRGAVSGQTGWLKFATRVRTGLVIRAPGVLQGPDGPYVLVAGDDRRTLTRRPVTIGSILYGHATVVSGLHENEYVASALTFFLDAERRLQERAAP